MKITDMPKHDRPEQRARQHGVAALTTSELLTLAIGARQTETAETLLAKSEGSLRRMALIPAKEIARIAGPAKSQSVAAIFELGRRFVAESREENPPIRSPKDVAAIMAPRMEDLPVEELHVLVLDAQHHLERDITVTRGILNSSLVHPREIFREAIAEKAAALIIVHNHPSGDPTPSADDRNVTDQLVAAGRLLDIPVHDHVIIGRGRYTSFAEAGLL